MAAGSFRLSGGVFVGVEPTNTRRARIVHHEQDSAWNTATSTSRDAVQPHNIQIAQGPAHGFGTATRPGCIANAWADNAGRLACSFIGSSRPEQGFGVRFGTVIGGDRGRYNSGASALRR